MESRSPLKKDNLEVAVEQVALFVTSKNVIISFFEKSAEDVEAPIIRRLSSDKTILRESCDATMVTQAIIDAIIDLALPVNAAYQNIFENTELNVLKVGSNTKYINPLYVLKSEMNALKK